MSAHAASEITLIHMGDVHGHLLPRPSVDGHGGHEGGLARLYTKIKQIRSARGEGKTLLVNTGDTIQGSAEALYTRGQALVDVLNQFRIDAFAPGNWEWVYGVDRFTELFAGERPGAPWNTVAANAYYDGEPYADRKGSRVLPPYRVREINGVKVGILGFTTDRGPQVVGKGVTKGVSFTKGDEEVKEFVKILREQEKVDLVVMLSELGLANNIRLAESTPGIDVILSSDMHEVTREPVVAKTGTLIVEAGQDGQVLGEFNLRVANGRITQWTWKLHPINDRIREDAKIAKQIRAIRQSFVSGPGFKQHVNPFNGTKLARPIDTVVGRTAVALHRMNHSHRAQPAVIEGTSHAFLADAFRAQADATIGAIRGFRYGTVVPPGPVKMEDLYHFMPIGPMIAKGTIKGKQLKNQIEAAADGSLNPDLSKWTGGWLFNFSGVTMDFDPYGRTGERARNIQVLDRATGSWKPLDPAAEYTYASYYYARDPNLINVLPAENITVVKGENGQPLDGVEVVVRHLQSLPDRTANPTMGRTRLVKPLPAPVTGSPEVQPWRGAVPEHPSVAEQAPAGATPSTKTN
jgi:sulfur-oxidizing protein SoxB